MSNSIDSSRPNPSLVRSVDYSTDIPGASHWSLRMRKGTIMRLTDTQGGANVGMLFYNPENLLERYNAPDSLKCQHTFKLTQGHCLYSDMGRIFASIIEDTHGWHDTVCGNSHANHIKRWGVRDYQSNRNDWMQNGHDAFLVELAKYGLGQADLAANVNWFSQIVTDETGKMQLAPTKAAGAQLTLRFEMDTLVILHTCPHPMNQADNYPRKPVHIQLGEAEPVTTTDACLTACDENRRGFQNNALYHLGR
jgi:urea carboxylase-associated protein 2